jgi:hypothetical protein
MSTTYPTQLFYFTIFYLIKQLSRAIFSISHIVHHTQFLGGLFSPFVVEVLIIVDPFHWMCHLFRFFHEFELIVRVLLVGPLTCCFVCEVTSFLFRGLNHHVLSNLE